MDQKKFFTSAATGFLAEMLVLMAGVDLTWQVQMSAGYVHVVEMLTPEEMSGAL